MEKIKKTILLVDSDPNFLCHACASLENAGYRVITKTDSHDILNAFSEGVKMDLVITNDMMPGMDGQEFLAVFRRKALSIPVILLTEHADISAYLKALNLGAYDYVGKPVSMTELNAIVKAAFRGSPQSSPYSGISRPNASL